MEGGRLSQPRHCRKGAQPVPMLLIAEAVVINTTACGLSHHSNACLPLDHCDLQRQMGVSNLPKVVFNSAAVRNQTRNHGVASPMP